MSKNKFKPAKYGYEVKEEITSEEDVIIEKGGKEMLKIDMAKIESLIEYLRKNANIRIRDLKGELAESFSKLTNYVSLLYETEHYSHFCQMLSKYFQNLTSIIPGTIGAYCHGCFVTTTYDAENAGCAPICAGSIPSDSPSWSFCSNSVILATQSNSKFEFLLLRKGDTPENKATAYVNVNYLTYGSFPGFTEFEKEELRGFGVEYVILCGYKDNGREYIKLTQDRLSLKDVKSRVSVISTRTFDQTGLLIIVILIILIGIFFAWRYWKIDE